MKLEKYKKVGKQEEAHYFVTAIEMSGKSNFTVRWRGIFMNDSHSGTLDAARFRFWIHPKETDKNADQVTITFHEIDKPFSKGEFEATFTTDDLRQLRDTINEILTDHQVATEGKHLELEEKYRSVSLPSGRLEGLYSNPRFL
jgi:hypothetical protein